jgi:hypothetical protein
LIARSAEKELMMAIKPLAKWQCDNCQQPVTGETGFLEWIEEEDLSKPLARRFYIVHNKIGCLHHSEHVGRRDNHLHYYLGTDGLQKLLEIAGNAARGKRAVSDMIEFVEIIRRLQVPYFEQARLHFKQYASDQALDDPAPLNWTTVDELKHIAERYGAADRL